MNKAITFNCQFGEPSKAKMTTAKVICILASWGGGMGGSSRRFYAHSLDRSGPMWEAKLINGEVEEFNPRWIVSVKEKTLVVVTTTSGHYSDTARIYAIATNDKPTLSQSYKNKKPSGATFVQECPAEEAEHLHG